VRLQINTLAACEGPVNKSISYLVAAGAKSFLGSGYCTYFCFDGLLQIYLLKISPIKIDNNTISELNLPPQYGIHASILSLYDNMRLKEPKLVERFQRGRWNSKN
jgi:molybdopterin-containing oxidoreductase family iron-sulfur binding subunit